ncbi:energy-coupling factor transporter transmembrane protein EcfT [archaeon]|nr:energy-coupling factor transporter transmembrane protein EcfT [archaeon]
MIRYCPRNSFVHRVSPTLKLFFLVVVLLLSVLFVNLYLQIALFLVVLLAIFVARLPLREVIRFAWIFFLLAPVMLLLQGLIHPVYDYVVFEFMGVKAYHAGLIFGLSIAFRLYTLGFLTPLIVMTTRVSDLVHSSGKFLPHFFVFGLAITFRFIPIFEEELVRIQMSKEARATKKSVSSIFSLLVPLFCNALKKSRTMSYSIESRGFKA